MTCAESRSLILMRKGELPKEREDELQRHVKTCADCAMYMERSGEMMGRLESLRSFEPILTNPQDLTSNILNAVEKAKRSTSAAGTGSGNLFGFLPYRAFRMAYGLFVLGSIGLFLTQQLTVATDIQLLEERMAAKQGGKAGIEVMYSVPSNLVNRLPKLKQVLSYLESGVAGERDGLFVIDGSSLSRVVETVGKVIFPSAGALSDDVSRKSLEALAKTIQRSASARVTIRSKERS